MTKKDILDIIASDNWMMERLYFVKSLCLPDWWIGAGFVRGKVWDSLHEYPKRTPLPDIDVIYYDKDNLTSALEKKMEDRLSHAFPENVWQVRNQARMHEKKHEAPYRNAIDGLSKWVEIPTCIGVTITSDNKLELAAPLGITHLVNLTVAPSPWGKNHLDLYISRMKKKRWDILWPKLQIQYPNKKIRVSKIPEGS